MTDAPEKMTEYPETRIVTWIDDTTREEVGRCEYTRTDLSRAAVAAELERVADFVDGPEASFMSKHMLAGAIRALITPEQSAALDAVKAEARREERERVGKFRPPIYSIYGADRVDAYAKGFCAGVEAYAAAIRAEAEGDG